jgi:hypothetical protein
LPDDNNDVSDIFLRDRVAGTIIRVSVQTGGQEANEESANPATAADNPCLVAFQSHARLTTNEVDNGAWDVYVRNWCSPTPFTELISLNGTTGAIGNDGSSDPAISADGCVVIFESWASNLVAAGPPGGEGSDDLDGDIFYRSRGGGSLCGSALTARISLHEDDPDADGRPGHDDSIDAAISGDGDYIVFKARTRNMVDNDTNSEPDIFIFVNQP